MKTPLEIAQRYDALGWNVLPARVREKPPRVAWQAFQTERTTRYLEGWFGGLEESNYWAMTGRVSGLVVVDCDSEAAVEWVEKVLEGEQTWTAATPKGRHYFFAYPAEGRVRSWSRHKGGFEVDVRADGSGVIVPPSIHPSGRRYRWLRAPSRGGKGLVEVPPTLAYSGRDEGAEVHVGRTVAGRLGLRGLLRTPPARGERNTWLTSVAGHYARKHADDFAEFERKVRRAHEKRVNPPLPRREIDKMIESVWKAEQRKEASRPVGSGLKGDGEKLWLERDDGEMALWSNFDIDALAVTVDPESNATWYQVALHRPMGDILNDAIDGATLGNWQKLQVWLANRRVNVVGRSVGMGAAARLQLYLEEQGPPTKEMLPWLGQHENLGFATFEGIIRANEVVPHEGAVPTVRRDAAPFRYGFVAEKEARGVLREVLTFHEEAVCGVFGAWWAACFLKAQIIQQTALFPFVALEASSESGKTTGFFSLMMQLNGNYQGQAEMTIASLRDRIAAHRNGIVWIDDMAEVDAVLDLIRQATSEGTRAKMAEGWMRQKAVRLVAPVVLSGEYLGKLGHEKALLDRAVTLKTGSPIHRKSLRDPARPQWDDILALRARYHNDLTAVSGTLVQLALRHEDRVGKGIVALRPGVGRVADKWAVLRFGSRLLDRMAGETRWARIVDRWIDAQEDLGAENDLTLRVLPALLLWEDFPTSAISREPDRSASVFLRDGEVWFSLEQTASQWKRIAGREWNPRTQSQAALLDQARALGQSVRKRWDVRTHNVRLQYWLLPPALTKRVVRRAGARRRRPQ